MEEEVLPLKEKLTTAVAIDYPAASEILVSFPDKWELVHHIRRVDNSPLYIAGMPPSQEKPWRDHFYGLAPEINLALPVRLPVRCTQTGRQG